MPESIDDVVEGGNGLVERGVAEDRIIAHCGGADPEQASVGSGEEGGGPRSELGEMVSPRFGDALDETV